MINPGTKLNYEQWSYLSGGNIRGYRKYVRNYHINLKNFFKNVVKECVLEGIKNNRRIA